MKWYLAPLVLVHRIVGATITAIIGSTFFLGVAGLILGILAVLLASLGYALLWVILFFVCFAIGWSMVAIIRIFDPEYAKDKKPLTEALTECAGEVSGDLRKMAKDHL